MSRWVEAHAHGLVVRDSDTHELETLESAEAKGYRAPNGEPIRDWLRSLIGPVPGVSVGDVAEIAGLTCLAVGGYLWAGLAVGLAIAGAALLYEGQCYARHPMPKVRPRLPRRLLGRAKRKSTAP